MNVYLTVFFGGLICATLLTPLVVHISHKLNILDMPGTRKVHKKPIPRTGGIAIIAGFLAAAIATFIFHASFRSAVGALQAQVTALLLASIAIGIMGMVDDISHLRARTKFAGQLLAAFALCLYGVRIDMVALPGLGEFSLGWFAWPLTMLWITGITNALNLIDGLDGLASGIGAIGAGVMAFFAVATGQPVLAVLSLGLLGTLIGFLIFNFHPAKVFMGDCGSTFVGFFLASASVLAAGQASNSVGVGMLALALGLPVFDTLFSMLRRFLERRSLFAPDRSHLHHRLLGLGLKHHHVVILIHSVAAVAAGLGILMLYAEGLAIAAIFVLVCIFLVWVFHAVGSIRLHESWEHFHRNMALAREAREQQKAFENAQLRLREARNFEAWWLAVCSAAEEMEFSSLTLEAVDGQGTKNMMLWVNRGVKIPIRGTVRTTVPIRLDTYDSPALQAQVDVPVLTSLESAGLRVKLFSRLIDEHRMFELPKSASGEVSSFTLEKPMQRISK